MSYLIMICDEALHFSVLLISICLILLYSFSLFSVFWLSLTSFFCSLDIAERLNSSILLLTDLRCLSFCTFSNISLFSCGVYSPLRLSFLVKERILKVLLGSSAVSSSLSLMILNMGLLLILMMVASEMLGMSCASYDSSAIIFLMLMPERR